MKLHILVVITISIALTHAHPWRHHESNLDEMVDVGGTIGHYALKGFAPTVEKTAKDFSEAVKEVSDVFGPAVQTAVDALEPVIEATGETIGRVVKTFKRGMNKHNHWEEE